MIVCTVFDDFKRAGLEALLASLRRHAPELPVLALHADDRSDPHDLGPNVEFLRLESLPIDNPWQAIATNPGTSREEALSGPLIEAALQRDERVMYLHSSVRILGPPKLLADTLERAEVALVAMREGPVPDDGRLPSQLELDAAGEVNPRVIAVRRSGVAEELLAQWPAHADSRRREGPAELIGNDVTRHLDAFVGRDGVELITSPGTGYGYWNADLRHFRLDGTTPTVGGDRLAVLDATGISAEDPRSIWSYQDRVELEDHPQLARLLLEIGDEVWSAGESVEPPFIRDRRDRVLGYPYRQQIREAIAADRLHAPPWTPEGSEEWERWLQEPAQIDSEHAITRLQVAVWDDNEELREAFPDLTGPDGASYTELFDELGANELVDRARDSAARSFSWGVNVAGFFRSQLGLGEAARMLFTSLKAAGLPVLPVHGRFVPPTGDAAPFEHTAPSQAPYPINVLCLNGEQIPRFAHDDPAFFENRYTIAMWWWEVVDAFPEYWHEAFPHIDEVWVATDHVHDAIAPHSPVPVTKIRMPVVAPRVAPLTRRDLGMPEDGFLFLYVFDYNSTAARKNPVGHVEAFKRAFGEGSGAKLVLKSINGANVNAQHLLTVLAADGHPDITLIDEFMTAAERDAMIANCDCYLSLHRSEGFGLTPAEAMALGKPVVATRYGGVLDFMTDENSFLVEQRPTVIGKNYGPYPEDATWAEPDLDHAATLMRQVFDRPEEARRRAERGRRDILERHSPEVTGGLLRERLEQIHEGLGRHAVRGLRPGPGAGWARAATIQRIETPVPPAVGRGRAIKNAVRTATAKILSPFLARQRGIDEHLLRGIDESLDHLRELVAREDRDVSELLRRLHVVEERLKRTEPDSSRSREDQGQGPAPSGESQPVD